MGPFCPGWLVKPDPCNAPIAPGLHWSPVCQLAGLASCSEGALLDGKTWIEVVTVPLERLAVSFTVCGVATMLAVIWKFALALPPGTITEVGAVMAGLSTEIAGTTEFGEGETKLTVQLAVPEDRMLAGEQLMLLNWTAAPSVIWAVTVWLLNVPDIVATEPLVTAPAVALNKALDWPAAMVTVGGTVSVVRLLDRFTTTGAAAGWVTPTLQIVLAPLNRDVGLQVIPLSWSEAARLIFAVWFWPLRLAVTTAWSLVVTVWVVAENVAVLDPAATVTVAGTWRAALLLANPTKVDTPALLLRDTVQVADWLLPSVAGLQETDKSEGTTREMLAVFEVPLRLTVTCAVWFELGAEIVAVKVALLWPVLNATLPGTVTLALSLLTVGLVPEVAGPVRLTVHVDVPAALKLAGEQLTPLNCAGAVKLTVNCWFRPFRLPVTIALWFCGIAPEFAEKLPLVCPVAIVTLLGTVRSALLLLRDTPTEFAAALFRVAVHVLVALLAIVLGEQDKDCNCAGARRFTDVVLVTPAALAVIVTPGWSVFTLAPVAVKVAVVWPDATVTFAGTVKLALLLESATWKPPDEAANVKVTVQEVFPGVLMDAAVQLTALKAAEGGTDTTILPDPPLAEIAEESAAAAAIPVRLIGSVPEALDESWKVAVPTTPPAIAVEFTP
jgi:hypothetical protein